MRPSTLGAFLGGCAIVVAVPAQAQTRDYSVPPGDLHMALTAFARQSGLQVLYRLDDIRGVQSRGARGSMSADAALNAVLAGTDFTFHRDSSGAIAIARRARTNSNGAPAAIPVSLATALSDDDRELVVTGTRIRGAPPTSPVITVTAEEMANAGQTDLGEVIRSIPQNFNGGQNPGIGFGAENDGSSNFGAASSLNLRGLGAGATLTLLNGRRLSYGGFQQGVDISAIAIGAVDRIEIVADGGSAIYGSDAVAGVANVILRRDYRGVTATGRIGGATDGGYTRYQFSGAVGEAWDTGSILVAADFNRSSPVRAGDRDYASSVNPTFVLYPYLRHAGGILSGRQAIGRDFALEADILVNRRVTEGDRPFSIGGDVNALGSSTREVTTSFLASPSLTAALPHQWSAKLNIGHGFDLIEREARTFQNGTQSNLTLLDNRNWLWTFELGAEGPLVTLPSGNVRLAVGAGYRYVGLRRASEVNGVPDNTRWKQDSYFAYGELFVPIVAPSQDIRGVHRLSFSAAFRHEDYPGLESVTTPRFGLTYAPSGDFTFSATWGRSFKAATLNDRFGSSLTSWAPASLLGGTQFPPTATALVRAGSNPDLRPERSENWTATLAVHPAALPGARFELSYFDIDYTDRIAQPINVLTAALATPSAAQFTNLSPTQSDINQAIAGATAPLQNFIGQPFNAATIVAIVDGRLVNVAKQRVNGMDALAQFTIASDDDNSLTGSLNVNYLRLRRQTTNVDPVVALAGRIFNPPNWRARAGLTWVSGGTTVAAHANYIGSLEDRRTTSTYSIGNQVTFDFVARYALDLASRLRRLDLSVAVTNVFNAKPQRIVTTSPAVTPFDFTNFSPIGRTLTFAVTTRF